jgi:hypothetical protein
VIAATLLAVAMWYFGHRQFGGFDHSALVDTAWRMVSFQRPYEDFYLTTPIAFYLGAGLAFAVWGPSWSALVWIAIAFALVSFALLTVSVASYASPKFSIALPLVCELLAMGITSYWWYNSITAIAACLFVAASIALVCRPSSRLTVAVFTLATFFLMMMKPNTAGVLVAVAIAILIGLRGARRQAILALAVSAAMLVALLAALGINPLEVMRTYIEMARTRGLPSTAYFLQNKPGEAYLTIALAVMCLIPLAATVRPIMRLFREGPRRYTQVALISIAGMATGVFGMFTNSDSNLVVGIPLILLSALSLLLWMSHEGLVDDHPSPWTVAATVAATTASVIGADRLALGPPLDIQQVAWGFSLLLSGAFLAIEVMGARKSSVLLIGILIFVAGIALLAGEERLRVKYIGPDMFYTDEPLVTIPGLPFFDGFLGSPRLREVVGEMSTALNQSSAQPDQRPASVYFGPRLEFAYAAFGLPSPRRLPVWYHPGISFPEAMTDTIVTTFVSQSFDMGIFLRTAGSPDFAYLPEPIIRDFYGNYRPVEYPEIVVFLRETR